MSQDQVFISYSHKDKRWRDDLGTHLKPYLRDGSIISWSDQQIAPGSKWFGEIKSALTISKVAVLLVSPDFLASDFILKHELGPLLKEAEQGGVRILWVPVRASSYKKTVLKDYQAVLEPSKPLANMTNAERAQAWVRICEEIEKSGKPLIGPSPEGAPGPYAEPVRAQHPPMLADIELPACFGVLGLPLEHHAAIAEWIADEVRARGDGTGRPDRYRGKAAFLESLGVSRKIGDAVSNFADLVVGCFVPERLLRGCFYISAQKVTQTYRSYRSLIAAAPDLPKNASDENVEDKFLLLHNYFRSMGQLVFTPQQMLLARGFPAGKDLLLFFVAEFVLERDNEMFEAFPAIRSLLAAGGPKLEAAVTTIFNDPDPALYPLVRFSGTILGRPVAATLSRKYFAINSLSYQELGVALGGGRVVVEGFTTARDTGEAAITLQPMLCDFRPGPLHFGVDAT